MVGFEPTLSGTPSRRIARLSHILMTRSQRSQESEDRNTLDAWHLTPFFQSVQRELNPRIYHGKVAGYLLHHGRCGQFRRLGSSQRPSALQADALTI